MNFFKRLFGKSSTEESEIVKQEVKLTLDDLFVHNFVNKGGKFLYCIHEKEITQNLSKILSENQWKELCVLDSDISKYLKSNEITLSEKVNTNVPVFTSCEHLIADNGDILFSSNQLGSIKLNDYSENFIVFATTSQIVQNTGQGLTGIKTHAKGSLPTNISAIKDYQVHEDYDNFLHYGNSNTKNLYLLLLENL